MRDFFQKLAGVFIRNKQLGWVSIVAIVVFGLIGFVLMPKQYNPEIVAPAFAITVEYPGATVEEVYHTVTRPLEDVVRQIPKVDDIFAQTTVGGSSVTVVFDIGSDKESAKTDLLARIGSNMNLRPLGVGEPLVREIDPDDVPIVTIALYSDKLSETSLRALANDFSDELKMATGVSAANVYGGQVQELRVVFDPVRAKELGVDLSKVINALRNNNRHILQSEFEQTKRNIPVEIFGNPDIAQIAQIKVTPEVRLDEVAKIELTAVKRHSYSEFSVDGQSVPAVFVGIAKHKGTNATVVSEAVLRKLEVLKENKLPKGVDVKVVRDDGAVASAEIFGLTKNLVISISIVTLVLLVFLSTRSALIVATAIPLSLFSVFGIGLLFDQTINRITLFALILSLGLLVDSATVVVENMVRQLRQKKSYEQVDEVVTRSVAEVSGGLIMSTVTTVLAFIPMAFVTGMMGPYMGPIPFFVPIALVASLVIALTINPFLGAWLLGKEVDNRENKANFGVGKLINLVQNIVASAVVKVQESYAGLMRKLFTQKKMRRSFVGALVVLLLISFSLPATGLVPFRMLPKADRNQFFVYLDLPQDSSLGNTAQTARQVRDEILSVQDIVSVQSYIGMPPVVDFNGLFKGSNARSGQNQATLKVNLSPSESRHKQSEEIAQVVREKLRKFQSVLQFAIVEDPPGPPVLSTFQLKIQSENYNDYPKLRPVTNELLGMLQDVPGVEDITTSIQYRAPAVAYRINIAKAQASGVSVRDITDTLQMALDGVQVGIYYDGDDNRAYKETRYMVIRLENEKIRQPADFAQIFVRGNEGTMISVSEFLQPQTGNLEDTFLTDNRYGTIYISGEMVNRSVVYASIDTLKKLVNFSPNGATLESWSLFGATYKLDNGNNLYIRLGGEWELTLEVFRDMGVAFAVAILAIYFVLVAQFRSLRIPLYVLATIPFALIGVFGGFAFLNLLWGTYFTATAMIGVIALAGIVVNNAIIYLEYVFDLRKEDMGLDEALITAGRVRLLPIALTSLTTVLGSLTIVTDPVWEGLAWAIILGLSLSAFLTLIILPLIYRKFEK